MTLCPFCKAELAVERMLVHSLATLSCRELLTLPATLSTDEQHAWLWFHNGVADEYAKAVLSQSDNCVDQCHSPAVQAVKSMCAAQAQVYALHRSVADIFGTKHHIRKSVSVHLHVSPL